MSWSLDAITGKKAKSPISNSKRASRPISPWMNHPLLGKPNHAGYSAGTPAKRTRSDNMMTGGKDLNPRRIDKSIRQTAKNVESAARQFKQDYKTSKRAVSSISAKIRKMKGYDEGYSVTHSEGGKGGMEFTEHYRDYDIARKVADKYEKKGNLTGIGKAR